MKRFANVGNVDLDVREAGSEASKRPQPPWETLLPSASHGFCGSDESSGVDASVSTFQISGTCGIHGQLSEQPLECETLVTQ